MSKKIVKILVNKLFEDLMNENKRHIYELLIAKKFLKRF
jgi:hypothetical protein